ncbi:hypothetical protein O181_034030 [Austropuccinia psidii MF-1]|uniref:Uncharacterized protein n=1 Tax=Austropuccinia psidii MF-1 TaxID=1389203 RepID=A0A9Q3D442_9BASI|nr:hypothetical protein [Austropuccinia psidii MF-1]
MIGNAPASLAVAICLYWCPGHIGISENKRVNTPAKLAAESQETSIYNINTISISILRQLTSAALINKSIPEEATHIGFKTPPKLITKALDLLEKGPAATIHQLQTGHVPLNNYL